MVTLKGCEGSPGCTEGSGPTLHHTKIYILVYPGFHSDKGLTDKGLTKGLTCFSYYY